MTRVTVTFGPSRSANYDRAVKVARDATWLWAEGQTLRADYDLMVTEPKTFGDLARLLAFVGEWRSTDVTLDGEYEPAWLVSSMALCARDYARRWGRCTWFDTANTFLPKCRICPLRPDGVGHGRVVDVDVGGHDAEREPLMLPEQT